MKTQLVTKAQKLRSAGYSYKEIAETLCISKNTSYRWTKDCQLEEIAHQRLKDKILVARSKSVKTRHLVYLQYLESLKHQQEAYLQNLPSNPVFDSVLCALIYWCEGAKEMTTVKFTNSDPQLIGTFLSLFRRSFTLQESKFRALIHLHEYHDAPTQMEFWSKVTNISESQFHRCYIKPHTGKTIRMDYPGCITVSYYDAKIAKLLLALAKTYMKNIGA